MAKKKEKEPPYYLSRIGTKVLNYRVYVLSAGQRLLYSLILLLAGGAIGLVFYGGLFKENGESTFLTYLSGLVVFVLVGALAIRFFLPIVTESLRKKRENLLKHQFCDFASALTNALASGMNMTDSLSAVYGDLREQYSDDSHIVREVKEIIDGTNNLIPVETMLLDFGERSGIPDITNFANVFATCYRTGGNLKTIVRRTTEIISEKIMIASEIETAITSSKMQMNIMTALPVLIVLMMRTMSSDFAESFASPVGVIGLTISAALTIAAFKLGRKITDIKG